MLFSIVFVRQKLETFYASRKFHITIWGTDNSVWLRDCDMMDEIDHLLVWWQSNSFEFELNYQTRARLSQHSGKMESVVRCDYCGYCDTRVYGFIGCLRCQSGRGIDCP